MSTLAEHHPELAARLGLNVDAIKRDGEYLGKLCIVTFREPLNPSPTRKDPIAFLPPDYQRFGIVDKAGIGVVHPGETWIVRPFTTGVGAVFLVPIAPIELGALLALDSKFIGELVEELASRRPDLLGALSELLPRPAPPSAPSPSPQVVAEIAKLREALQAADQALALAQTLPDLFTKARQAAAPLLAPAPVKLEEFREKPIYLADANLFINAKRWNWTECNRVLDSAGLYFQLAVTRAVYNELHHSFRLPADLIILEAAPVEDGLRELALVNASATGKKAGEADLSLVQALLADKRIRGIITEDPDIRNIHPESLVRKLDGRDVECVTAAEFCQRHKKLVKG